MVGMWKTDLRIELSEEERREVERLDRSLVASRAVATLPAQPGGVPVHLEHEYQRKGALQLFAAFDTRSGQVLGILRRRKRQAEFIELLEKIDRETPQTVTLIHLVCDNLSVHHGKLVRAWLAKHPRFQMHFTPVHCSWMNQVEQWFSILQRKRLTAPNFADLGAIEERVLAFITEWNAIAPYDQPRICRSIAAWNAHDLPRILSHYEDDSRWHRPGSPISRANPRVIDSSLCESERRCEQE
jgi:transposase